MKVRNLDIFIDDSKGIGFEIEEDDEPYFANLSTQEAREVACYILGMCNTIDRLSQPEADLTNEGRNNERKNSRN